MTSVDGGLRELVSRVAAEFMRAEGFSGGWDHDGLADALVSALALPDLSPGAGLVEAARELSRALCRMNRSDVTDEVAEALEKVGKALSATPPGAGEKPIGRDIAIVDEEIRPIVQALWNAGIDTVASCSGHGHRPGNIALADGRELVIAPDFETGRKIDALFPLDIHGQPIPGAGEKVEGADIPTMETAEFRAKLASVEPPVLVTLYGKPRFLVLAPGACRDDALEAAGREALASIETAIESSAIEWNEPIRPSKRGEADDDEQRQESKAMAYNLLVESAAKLKAALASLSPAKASEGARLHNQLQSAFNLLPADGDPKVREARAIISAAMTEAMPGYASLPSEGEPIPMILHCPKCGLQHVDEPEPGNGDMEGGYTKGWTNPPHRSHLCHRCGTIWRPADVPTEGVAGITTKGKADTWEPASEGEPEPRAKVEGVSADERAELLRLYDDEAAKLAALMAAEGEQQINEAWEKWLDSRACLAMVALPALPRLLASQPLPPKLEADTPASIASWADDTFGKSTPLAMAKRAAKEMAELVEAAELSPAKVPEEIADVQICLMRLAHMVGCDPDAEVSRKMAVNRARVWTLNGDGTGQHKARP